MTKEQKQELEYFEDKLNSELSNMNYLNKRISDNEQDISKMNFEINQWQIDKMRVQGEINKAMNIIKELNNGE